MFSDLRIRVGNTGDSSLCGRRGFGAGLGLVEGIEGGAGRGSGERIGEGLRVVRVAGVGC